MHLGSRICEIPDILIVKKPPEISFLTTDPHLLEVSLLKKIYTLPVQYGNKVLGIVMTNLYA